MKLLSIVGDDISRIIPLLYAYKNEVKYHILLCDDDNLNKERAKTLKKGMKRFSGKHKLGWKIKIITTNEDESSEIEQAIKKEFDYDGKLWLNATDGYPAMTILLSDLVRKEGGKVLSYDHFDNDLHIIESEGSMKTIPLSSKIDIESYLTLLDYKIISKSEDRALKQRKNLIFKLYENEQAYIEMKKALVKKMNKPSYKFDFTPYASTLNILQKMKITNAKGKLIRTQQKALQGDILEEYLYWLCVPLKPDDIMVGVKIDLEGSKVTHPHPKVFNELDVLIMQNNRLCTIECKFSDGLSGLDVVYKYDGIIDYFGNASKAIIANVSSSNKEPYMGMNASSNFSRSTLRRARMSGIDVYHESKIDVVKFQNLVRNFFHIN